MWRCTTAATVIDRYTLIYEHLLYHVPQILLKDMFNSCMLVYMCYTYSVRTTCSTPQEDDAVAAIRCAKYIKSQVQ
jgi:hypothetical protein